MGLLGEEGVEFVLVVVVCTVGGWFGVLQAEEEAGRFVIAVGGQERGGALEAEEPRLQARVVVLFSRERPL